MEVALSARSEAAVRKALGGARRRRPELSSLFSPHLEKLPRKYYAPRKGEPPGAALRDNPGAVARLLIEAHEGERDKMERAAKLARRALEMIEHELQNPHVDCFVDAAGSGQARHVRKMLRERESILDGRHTVLGYCALHAACDFGQLKMVQLLVAAGADLYATRKDDLNTPLHCAAENGHAPVVRYLVLEVGVDKLRRNRFGLTPFDYASLNGHDLIMDILREPPGKIENVAAVPAANDAAPRSMRVEWDLPDDNGVDLIEFQVSYVPIAGKALEIAANAGEHISTLCVPADGFGPNPHRARKEESLQRRRAKMDKAQTRAARRERVLEAREANGASKGAPETHQTAGANNKGAADEAFLSDDDSSSDDGTDTEEGQGGANSNAKTAPAHEANGRAWGLLDGVLTPATTYAVTVRARSVAGWSTPSEKTVFSTQPDVPAPPGKVILDTTGATCASIDLMWAAPQTNNGRVVQVYELQMCALPRMPRSDEQHTPAQLLHLIGDDSWQVVAEEVQGHTVKLVNGAKGNVKKEKEINPLHWTVRGLQSGSPFLFRARARNAVGAGDFSAVSAVLWTRPATLAPRIGATSMDIDWSESIDTETERKGVLRWEVQRTVPPADRATGREPKGEGEDPGDLSYDWRTAPWEVVSDRVPGKLRTMTVRKLRAATMYYFRVRPVFEEREHLSPPWNECAVSLGLVTRLAVPEEPLAPIVAHAGVYEDVRADLRHDSVRITWRAPRDNGRPLEAFSVRYCDMALGSWTQVPGEVQATDEGGGEAYFEYRVHGLQPGRAYKFAVRARNDIGWGSFSSPSKAYSTRAAAPPAAPRLVWKSDSVVRLEWEMAGEARADRLAGLSYQVQFAQVELAASGSQDGLPEAPEWEGVTWRGVEPRDRTECNEIQAMELQPVSNYVFRVRARLAGDGGEWTNFSAVGGPFRTGRRF